MSDVVYLNGQFVPEEQAAISIADRAFTYGDGIFETLLVKGGQIVFWQDHWDRFAFGAEVLRIPLAQSTCELQDCARHLVELNEREACLLKLQLTRGPAARGYSIKSAITPTLIMTIHDPPAPVPKRGWEVVTSSIRLPRGSRLSRCKTCNRLPQILARAEADQAGADDALLLSEAGEPLELSAANLFWLNDGKLRTPSIESGVLPGVTRQKVLNICRGLEIPCEETVAPFTELLESEGAFCTLTTFGVVEIVSVDGSPMPRSSVTSKVRDQYEHEVRPVKR